MMFYEWQWRRSLSVGITPFSKAVQWIWLGSFSGRSVTPGPCVWHPLTLGSLLYKHSPVGAAVALHWPPFGLSCAQPSSVAVSPLTPRQHGSVVAGRQRQLAEDTLRSTSNRRRPPLLTLSSTENPTTALPIFYRERNFEARKQAMPLDATAPRI